jgi:hypothetical protein
MHANRRESKVFGYFVKRVAGIIRVDGARKDRVDRDCRAEHVAQALLAFVVVACERGQEPVWRASTAP